VVCVVICAHSAPAQTPLKTIEPAGGGKIVYGQVDGATNQAAAMSAVLHIVHQNCGDKPQVGKVFKVRGTDSVAAFFTTAKCSTGSKPVAGLVIATEASPKHIEAALVSDDAARFGKTINPLLTKLFGLWHPGGTSSSSGSATGASWAPPAALHLFTASDRSASVGVPDGWQAKGQQGTMMVTGPHGETVGLDLTRMAIDPSNPMQRRLQQGGLRSNNSGKIVYPANVNLVRAFPDIFQQFWRMNGANPTNLQIAHSEQMPGSQGQRCAHVTGHVDLSGKGAVVELNSVLCTTPPASGGTYLVMLSLSFLAPEIADKERATMGAILASFQPNQAVINQQIGAIAGPAIAFIHQIGKDASDRAAASSLAHDQQNQAWRDSEVSQDKHNQAFNNYLLDQTVLQDNDMDGNGTVGHGTVWNSTADVLVKSDPNRYEIVDTPNFWKGIDY